ncbi:MAG: helix-turn-helix domain-containing protein [Proteobacteria bacterium]|nr:helix-turn-helix domain-containing protein [Pseudomonadota bacterium]
MPETLMMGQVSILNGCNIETIRYYEKEGMLPAPGRSSGGHRLYSTALVQRLRFIRRSRELGFSLAEVRQLLEIVDGEHVSCVKVKEIADAHLVDIREKIVDLQKMETSLARMALQCSGRDVPECPIVEVLQGES